MGALGEKAFTGGVCGPGGIGPNNARVSCESEYSHHCPTGNFAMIVILLKKTLPIQKFLILGWKKFV